MRIFRKINSLELYGGERTDKAPFALDFVLGPTGNDSITQNCIIYMNRKAQKYPSSALEHT
jgi:hypothetical protein